MKVIVKWLYGKYRNGKHRYIRREVSAEGVPEMLRIAYKAGSPRVHIKFIKQKEQENNV